MLIKKYIFKLKNLNFKVIIMVIITELLESIDSEYLKIISNVQSELLNAINNSLCELKDLKVIKIQSNYFYCNKYTGNIYKRFITINR